MPNPVLHQLNVLGSVVSSTLGLWRGAQVLPRQVPGRQPALPLRLYDIEACPYCRRVREALTALHLDAEIYPCPRGGTRFRPEALRLAGKAQFPLLVDMNTNTVMLESADIVAYLFRTYGGREVPAYYRTTPLQPLLASAAAAVRGLRGLRARPARVPAQPLALWSFESSPYSRLVRERLCELEIPYVLHNIGKERWQDIGPAVMRLQPGAFDPIPGSKREAHYTRTGHMQVPYLEDPNTGVQLLESADIIDYLERIYAQ
ncbi:MAG: glutathione S-transferase N-terminal domain-containing protein [Moraxellaceae bacterium]|nr:glutathione S-transferase N-terminal domain-containing protein [Moraxellaceae bacterium]